MIDGKPFFDIPVKNKEAYEAIIEMSRNDDYTTGKLLDYEYFSKHYTVIAIDLSKQTEFDFNGRLEINEGAKMFFIIEKKKETSFDFSQTSVTAV